MRREGIDRALVGYLPAAWHRSVREANRELLKELAPHKQLLSPLPCVNPLWPRWEKTLGELCDAGIAGVRIYPPQWGMDASSSALLELGSASAEQRVTLVLTTRFEDVRQRHRMDSAADVDAGTVRRLVRSSNSLRVLLSCAGRSLIEEIHWSLTPQERARVWYDISWIWGPPGNDLAHLISSIGAERFLFGSMWPLRLVQTPLAGLDLMPDATRTDGLGSVLAAFPGLS
jgi:hypothetical protein